MHALGPARETVFLGDAYEQPEIREITVGKHPTTSP
jgi:hypothetical protein